MREVPGSNPGQALPFAGLVGRDSTLPSCPSLRDFAFRQKINLGIASLYSSVAEHWSCKPAVESSILSGGMSGKSFPPRFLTNCYITFRLDDAFFINFRLDFIKVPKQIFLSFFAHNTIRLDSHF